MNPRDVFRSPEIAAGPGVGARLRAALSRTWLQPFWRALHFVSLRGMGFKNIFPQTNGESRFWSEWARRTPSHRSLVLVDVGANEGDFSAALAPQLARAEFHCFEPNPPTLRRLRRRFAWDQRFHVNACGLSGQEEEAEIFDFADGGGTGQASLMREMISNEDHQPLVSTRVRMTTLDAYAASHGIEYIDYLKIDVEGLEANVLDGARNLIDSDRIGLIQLEWNTHNAATGFTLYRLQRQLKQYSLYKMLPDGLVPLVTPSHRYRCADEVFLYSNLVAVHRHSLLAAA